MVKENLYSQLKTKLKEKNLSEGSINLYLRNLKKLNNDEEFNNLVLANPDEIQSYSHNIASELVDSYSLNEIKTHLSNLTKQGISQHLDLYNKYFIGTHDAHFLKKLYKRVYKYTVQLEPKLINKL